MFEYKALDRMAGQADSGVTRQWVKSKRSGGQHLHMNFIVSRSLSAYINATPSYPLSYIGVACY